MKRYDWVRVKRNHPPITEAMMRIGLKIQCHQPLSPREWERLQAWNEAAKPIVIGGRHD